MATDKKQYIWLATFHKGILRSTKPFDPQSRLSFEPVSSGSGNTVLCVTTDKRGDLWFGNNRSELIHYHSDTGKLSIFPIRVSDNPQWTGWIWTLLFDSQERLWLGTSNGLLLFDPVTGLFTHYSTGSGAIRAMTEISGECLWLGNI